MVDDKATAPAPFHPLSLRLTLKYYVTAGRDEDENSILRASAAFVRRFRGKDAEPIVRAGCQRMHIYGRIVVLT